ncbi:MAG: signal peptide peptidase SppA [Saprospiraceae bacterium]|nr:signal peptide peptidase SppA [Saprospiraceae bacterium]
MVSFLKNIVSSCLGTVLGLGLLILIIIGIGSAIGSLQQDVLVKDRSVLRVHLPDFIPERTNNLPMGLEYLTQENVWGIHDLAHAIREAAQDSDIEAIILETGNSQSFVHMDILRQALHVFKRSGKPVYAYGDYYGQIDLYLTSIADSLYLNPLGQAELKGFAIIEPFVKDALENVGIEMEVYYAGDFKSATEPFRRNSMSEENEIQLREFLNELYSNLLDSISVSRGIPSQELRNIASTYSSRRASDALRLGLVDVVGYDGDLIKDLKERLGYEESIKMNVIELSRYRTHTGRSRNYFADNKMAVIYMEGEIRDDGEDEGRISAKRYVPMLRKIGRDDEIKAVVLRINSPGGDAMTSDKILAEIKRLRSKGKTVVASLGDVAASGGYYIATQSDSIFASQQTITGSIGVFSIFPNINRMFEDKLNIYMDSVSTSRFAGIGSYVLERSEAEKKIFQESTDSMYNVFLNIVATGRNMAMDQVKRIAQGRIWTGETALELGLIDEIGDLPRAMDCAAGIANIEDYRVIEYPESKSPLQQLSEELSDMGDMDRQIGKAIDQKIPGFGSYYRLLDNSRHIQAWMPYRFILN